MSRKRARDLTPSDDLNNIGSTGSISDQNAGQSNDFSRFTDIMAEFFKSNTRKPESSVRGDVIPIFDPEDRDQEIEAWCLKVDELREVFGWTEEATIYFALGRLRGLAEIWFKGLQTVKMSWVEWKEKLLQAFPYRKDFCDSLTEMLRRSKRPDETYSKYFYEKCALLSGCKIQGADAVSCIIGGISDNVVKTGAKAGRHQTVESLHEFLNTIGNSTSAYRDHNSKFQSKSSKYFSNASKRFKSNFSSPYQKERQHNSEKCYTCGKRGHISKNCILKATNRDSDMICTYCNQRGHIEAKCFLKKRGNRQDQNPKPIA